MASLGPTLSLMHCFGLKSDVKENVWYFDDQNIVYPAGNTIVIYDTLHRTQKFIPGTDRSLGITSLTVSPNRRFIAFAESGDRPSVSIFDLFTLRKKKTLTGGSFSNAPNQIATDSHIPLIQCKTFVSLAFSADSKFLLTQGGAPDWPLIYWSWEKSKAVASTKTSNQLQGYSINQVSFCTQDSSLICSTGTGGMLRMMRCVDGVLKTLPTTVSLNKQGSRESQNFLCHSWISEDRVVVGTDTGELLLYDNADFKHAIPQSPQDHPIEAIVPCAKGFICGGKSMVYIFEKGEGLDVYKLARSFKIDAQGQIASTQSANSNFSIRSLGLTPSEEVLAVTLENNQLITLNLSSTDIVKEPTLEHLAQSSHNSSITGLDTCTRKPLIVTCSVDRSIRIWNYKTNTNEQTKYFPEEAYSVAFHPSGYHILVGFSDKLRFMNVLLGDIAKCMEFDVRSCRECRFSNGGQYFAAVNSNLIQVFNTYTFENVANLRGHTGKVRSICWSADDTRLFSAGIEGAVYEWSIKDSRRLTESVLKSCSYSCVVTNDVFLSVTVNAPSNGGPSSSTPATTSSSLSVSGPKSLFAVGSDKKLKEISDSQIVKDYDSPVCITQLSISHTAKILFAGTELGSVRAYRLPLTGEFYEFQAHIGPVSRLKVSIDDTHLFSASDDCTLAVMEVRDSKERKLPKAPVDADFSDEILVSRLDVEEKNAQVNEMKNKYEELTLQHEYQMKLKELNYQEKTKEIGEKMNHDIDAWKIRYDALVQEKHESEAEAKENLKILEARYQQKLSDMDRKYQQKIVDEVERYHQLSNAKDEMQEDFERQVFLLKESHLKMTQELSEEYQTKYRDDFVKLERAKDEREQMMKEFDETRKQIEDDIEFEIEDQKEQYEEKLASERATALQLNAENNTLKKRFSTLQKDIDDHKEEITSLFEQKKQLYHTIHQLEKEVGGLKKEIKERDETIGDKEKRIYDLKKKNQELEKFKFVLDYKIKELKKQIEPLNKEIGSTRGQIKEMDGELERYHKTCANQELTIADLRLKVETLQKEIGVGRRKASLADALSKRFRVDLQECIQHIQDPKPLKEAVKKIYQKYMEDPDIDQEDVGLEVEIQQEYQRQREHLERMVSSLRKKLSKDEEIHRSDNQRIMTENMALITEINNLRRELRVVKQNKEKEKDKDTIVQVASPPVTTLKQLKKLKLAPSTNSNTPRDARPLSPPPAIIGNSLIEASKIIEMQKEEIRKLRKRIDELENLATSRPTAREKLPPMDGTFGNIETLE